MKILQAIAYFSVLILIGLLIAAVLLAPLYYFLPSTIASSAIGHSAKGKQ